MSTNATISVKTPSDEYANVYVHYDGYPSNMIPALANHSDEEIITAQDIRYMNTSSIDPFPDPKPVSITDTPEKLYGTYHYVKDRDGNWRETSMTRTQNANFW